MDDPSPQRARTTPQDAKENAKEEGAAALRGGIALGHLEITRAVLTTLCVPQYWVGLRIMFFLELMARGLILGAEFLLGRTLGICRPRVRVSGRRELPHIGGIRGRARGARNALSLTRTLKYCLLSPLGPERKFPDI